MVHWDYTKWALYPALPEFSRFKLRCACLHSKHIALNHLHNLLVSFAIISFLGNTYLIWLLILYTSHTFSPSQWSYMLPNHTFKSKKASIWVKVISPILLHSAHFPSHKYPLSFFPLTSLSFNCHIYLCFISSCV